MKEFVWRKQSLAIIACNDGEEELERKCVCLLLLLLGFFWPVRQRPTNTKIGAHSSPPVKSPQMAPSAVYHSVSVRMLAKPFP